MLEEDCTAIILVHLYIAVNKPWNYHIRGESTQKGHRIPHDSLSWSQVFYLLPYSKEDMKCHGARHD